MKGCCMMLLLFLSFMALLKNARMEEHIVIDSNSYLLSGTKKEPVWPQQLVFHASSSSPKRVLRNRSFSISGFSKSKRKPGVGHMQIYSAKGILISRHSLHGGGRDMQDATVRQNLRSVPIRGGGH